jgi:hypothetical protein
MIDGDAVASGEPEDRPIDTGFSRSAFQMAGRETFATPVSAARAAVSRVEGGPGASVRRSIRKRPTAFAPAAGSCRR